MPTREIVPIPPARPDSLAVVVVPLPRQGRGGDVRNAPHAPVAAMAHLANVLPVVRSAEFPGVKHDGWPAASATIDAQCSVCFFIGDMQIIANIDAHDEVKCPECGESTYVRTAD